MRMGVKKKFEEIYPKELLQEHCPNVMKNFDLIMKLSNSRDK
jgi:hypothetical protein